MTTPRQSLRIVLAKSTGTRMPWLRLICLWSLMFLPLAEPWIPQDYESAHNLIPALQWLAVGIYGGLTFIAILVYAWIILGVAISDRDDADNNDLLASLVSRLGFFGKHKLSVWVSRFVMLAGIVALWASECYTSGTIILALFVMTRVALVFANVAVRSWLKSLPDTVVQRLLTKPWEKED